MTNREQYERMEIIKDFKNEPYIQIRVSVPFEGCKLCKSFSIDCEKRYSNDRTYAVRYFCTDEDICINAAKMAGEYKRKEGAE